MFSFLLILLAAEEFERLDGWLDRLQEEWNANKMQTNIQYMMDKEDNYLQQDMVSLQSYFSRRDQALSLAASLVQKVNNTMSSGIQAIR